jgi:ribosome-binding factor A
VIKVPAVKRSVRVGELLLKEIADLIEHRVRDPRVGRVTLTGVSMSNDLKSAKVFSVCLEIPTKSSKQRKASKAQRDLLSVKLAIALN